MTLQTNVADVERWASALGGAALTVYAVRQLRHWSPVGFPLVAAGTALIYRGATGHCAMYEAAGITTLCRPIDTRSALSNVGGVAVEEVVTIDRSAPDLYRCWRNLEKLPMFMEHLVSVRQLDQRRSHWIAKGPAGRTVAWDAEIINELPEELIAWRTLHGADIISVGSVRFMPSRAGRGTEIRIRLQYEPPGGRVGSAIARMFGGDPSRTIREGLRRFKRFMETGEIPTIKGQPRGGR